jgi:hypothetical protein
MALFLFSSAYELVWMVPSWSIAAVTREFYVRSWKRIKRS